MKKLFFTIVLLLGLAKNGSAQTELTVIVNKDICLTEMSVTLSDESVAEVKIGCEGRYHFDFSPLSVVHLTINGVECFKNTTTAVTVDENQPATSSVTQIGNTIVDDLNGLIR